MNGFRGMFAGVLALVALEAVVSTSGAAGRVGGLLGTVAGLVTRLLDPTVAAIPDRRTAASPGAASAATGSASSTATVVNVSSAIYTPPPPANGKPRPGKPVVYNV